MGSASQVLVTGATGFIGGHLAMRLHAEGYPLRLLVRDPSRLAPALAAGAEVVSGGLDDQSALATAVQGVSTIFHCAANVRTWDRREAYWQSNVEGVDHLLGAVQRSGARPRLVHLSSADVYGFPRQPCAETCPPQAAGFGYGDSKIAGEALVQRAQAEWGLPTVILRPTNVMGPGSPFIARIGHELQHGLMLSIDHGEVDAGFLGIDHLLDVILWAATSPRAIGEVFNVKDTESVSWRRFLMDLRQGLGARGWLIQLPYPVAEAAAQAMAWPYQILGLRQEPLLHPLIVRIFGRSCGHSAAKVHACGAPTARQGYSEVMAAAIEWYRHLP